MSSSLKAEVTNSNIKIDILDLILYLLSHIYFSFLLM